MGKKKDREERGGEKRIEEEKEEEKDREERGGEKRIEEEKEEEKDRKSGKRNEMERTEM